MENQILDHFDDEKPNPSSLLFIKRVNLVFGILLILIGFFLIYSTYYQYDLQNTLLVTIYFPKYKLLAELCFGVLFLLGGFCIIKRKNLGIKIILVVSIAMLTYYFMVILILQNSWIENLLFLILAGILSSYSNWKKLPYLYSNLSLHFYLWFVGIFIGVIPFIFYYDELGF